MLTANLHELTAAEQWVSQMLERANLSRGSELWNEVHEAMHEQLQVVQHQINSSIKSQLKENNRRAAVSARGYKNALEGNVNILGSRRRVNSARQYPQATKRVRSVSGRTKQIYGYQGLDAGFILRILNSGADVRTAHSESSSGRGSKSTHGARGAITARGFLNGKDGLMDQAAVRLGKAVDAILQKAVRG